MISLCLLRDIISDHTTWSHRSGAYGVRSFFFSQPVPTGWPTPANTGWEAACGQAAILWIQTVQMNAWAGFSADPHVCGSKWSSRWMCCPFFKDLLLKYQNDDDLGSGARPPLFLHPCLTVLDTWDWKNKCNVLVVLHWVKKTLVHSFKMENIL